MRSMRSSTAPWGFSLGLQPAMAWTAILALVIFTALATIAGAGIIVRIAFPIGAFAVGLLLYSRYPVLYVSFTWWIWFLTPLLSRLIDYRSGWDDKRLILVAPFLVTLITLLTFLKRLPKSYSQGGLPFILAFAGVFYAFFIGLINGSPLTATRALLDWLTPILFGFHLLMNWRDYPSYRQNIQRCFLWGVLVTGIYGIVQYIVAPEWDRLWLVESGMTAASGSPEPLGMRVWSTMHSPGPFASTMMAGLMLLFSNQSPLKIAAAGVGYLSFLLSLVRSAWGGWFVAFLTLIISLKERLQIRLILTVFILAIVILPITTIEPFASKISDRFQTFSNLNSDVSATARAEAYDEQLNKALSNVLGNGLGSVWTVGQDGALNEVVLDSGVLDMFFTLGWFGAIPYLSGLVLILFSVLQHAESRFDPFVSAARAISVGNCAQMFFGSSILGLSGMLLWGFLGMCVAAHRYYQHQNTASAKRN